MFAYVTFYKQFAALHNALAYLSILMSVSLKGYAEVRIYIYIKMNYFSQWIRKCIRYLHKKNISLAVPDNLRDSILILMAGLLINSAHTCIYIISESIYNCNSFKEYTRNIVRAYKILTFPLGS